MQYKELCKAINKITNEELKQCKIAKAIGMSRAGICYRAANNFKFSREEIIEICNLLRIDAGLILPKEKHTEITKSK